MDSRSTDTGQLLSASDKPDWFEYPQEFLWVCQTGLDKFRPWKILREPHISSRMAGLKKRYVHRDLIPFALRLDCDDVACWERTSIPKVVIIHDFGSVGWESRTTYGTFWEWFRAAISDFIDFESRATKFASKLPGFRVTRHLRGHLLRCRTIRPCTRTPFPLRISSADRCGSGHERNIWLPTSNCIS
jgi:hypothetical protein